MTTKFDLKTYEIEYFGPKGEDLHKFNLMATSLQEAVLYMSKIYFSWDEMRAIAKATNFVIAEKRS